MNKEAFNNLTRKVSKESEICSFVFLAIFFSLLFYFDESYFTDKEITVTQFHSFVMAPIAIFFCWFVFIKLPRLRGLICEYCNKSLRFSEDSLLTTGKCPKCGDIHWETEDLVK